MGKKQRLSLDGSDELQRWMSAMTDSRSRTLELLKDLSDGDLERGEPNAIGTVLYHLALIEADWLVDEILDDTASVPMELFPYEVREKNGVLSPVKAMSKSEHLDRLAKIRELFVDRVGSLSSAELQTFHERPGYDVTPAYVIHHLLQHEAEHRAEIGRARER